jgi:putative ubiquitin-RnfH superfamily antitoxin RatB of RatAB toxin-antitoxin module
VDVLSILIELALSFASIIYLRLQHGFVVQEVEREEAILEIEKELKRETNDINVLTRVCNLLLSMVVMC